MRIFHRNQPATQPAEMPQGRSAAVYKGANAALDKAAQVYRRNPKLIGALAAVAGAALLTRMKRKPH
jgi:hypothetical protein